MVRSESSFSVVGNDFIKFILEKVSEYENDNNKQILDIVFVAHNGRTFDVPFLMNHFIRFDIDTTILSNRLYLLDTLVISRKVVKDCKLEPPTNFKLNTIYNYCTKEDMTIAHRAEPDVTATIKVFQHKPFFKKRKEFVFKVMDDASVFPYNEENAKQFSPNDDSDTDRSISSSSNSSSSTSSTDSNDMDALDPSNLESNYDQQTTTTTEEVFPIWKHKTIFWGELCEPF